MVPLGVSAAGAVAVGHAIGAGNPAKARRAGWMAIALGVGFMALAALLFIVLPRPILEIYSRDVRVLQLGAHILLIVAAFQIFDGAQSVATGVLRGMGETRIPMLLNFGGYWLFGLPLGALLCFKLHWGLSGLWIGLTVALITIAVLMLLRWRARGGGGGAGASSSLFSRDFFTSWDRVVSSSFFEGAGGVIEDALERGLKSGQRWHRRRVQQCLGMHGAVNIPQRDFLCASREL